MKKIIILFLMLNSLFCFSESKKNTKQMINEDCEYLKKYVTNAYANYDLDVEKGFDIDETIKTIKSSYKKNYGYKNNLRINDFGWLIGFTLGQDLPIKDNHLTIKTPEFDSTLFSQENAYYSDIYFEKVGTEYKIKYSSLVNFSKGMTYTNDESIKINNCKKKIETKRNSLINIPRKEIGYKSTDKNIYISLGTCDVSDRIVREFVIKQILLVIEKLKNENLEKNVILDIRNNTGGREEIIDSLIFGIFYRETYSSNRNYEEMFEVGEKGSFQLFSKETEEANNIQLPESKRNKNLENYHKHRQSYFLFSVIFYKDYKCF